MTGNIQPLAALLELPREAASHPGRAEISENRGVRACFGGQSGHTMVPVRNPARRKWYIERSKKHSKEGVDIAFNSPRAAHLGGRRC